MGKQNVSRIKTIPAPVFYKMWHLAGDFGNKYDYIRHFTSVFSKDYIDSNKFEMPADQYISILMQVHKLHQISIKELVERSGLTKAGFGYKYCIPIRTIEEWYKEDKSPDYVRLFILKDLGLFQLPRYVHIEERTK